MENPIRWTGNDVDLLLAVSGASGKLIGFRSGMKRVFQERQDNPGKYMSGNSMLKQLIKIVLRDVYWAYHGKGLKNPPLPVSPKSILYVCKGNICRSPFAERLTKKLAEKGSNSFLTILSAGIDATFANPPPKEAIDSAKNFGISMDDHRARRLTQEMISGSDMIVVMEVEHLHRLEEAYPELKDKFFLLSMFSHEKPCWGSYYNYYNIADPFGEMQDQFILCYKIIEINLKNLLYEIGFN